uniref:Uncharacterized protein n=1 Tax=Anguilla anguilla TaxID=7936 RepID=A0A0E9WBN1_ANGAN
MLSNIWERDQDFTIARGHNVARGKQTAACEKHLIQLSRFLFSYIVQYSR